IHAQVEVEVTAELSVDVGCAGGRVQLCPCALIRECGEIPGIRKLRTRVETNAGEVGKNGRGSRASEYVRAERVEGCIDADFYRAIQRCTPHVGRELESEKTLRAFGCAGIATDGRSRS